MPDEDFKSCSRCQAVKPLDQFTRDRQKPDGLRPQCRSCQAEIRRNPDPRPTVEERFWAKVDRGGGLDCCWPWDGAMHSAGYGSFAVNRRTTYAHRYAYELVVGPIPSGTEIDHLCRNRRCVNPAHLEPVTHRENMLRGETVSAAAAAKTHCKRGHPLSGDNLRVRPNGKRECRECERLRDRRRTRTRGNPQGQTDNNS